MAVNMNNLKKGFDSIINSKEYECKLSEHLTSLLRRTKSSATESSIAFAFESEIYLFVRNFFNIDIDFRKEDPAELPIGYNIWIWNGKKELHNGLLEYLQLRNQKG